MSVGKKDLTLVVLLGLVLLPNLPTTQAASLEADMVLYNGKILTADTEDPAGFSIVEAVVIYDGKFVAVGTSQEALELAGPSTRRIDLAGKTVLPGLIETHLHVNSMTGRHQLEYQAGATDPPIQWTSKEDVLAQLRTLALAKKPGDWIVVGMLETPTLLRLGVTDPNSEAPTLAELDQAAPNHPAVLLLRAGGTSEYFPQLVNSRALNVLYEGYPQGVPGIVKDGEGKPTGMVKITAAMVMSELWPPVSRKKLKELAVGYRKELEEAAARGLTTLATRVDTESQRVYQLLDSREDMPIRLAYATQMAAYTPHSDLLFRRVPMAPGHGSPWLWLSGATIGTIEYGSGPANGDACIHGTYPRESENFANWPHQPFGPHGDCRLTEGENATVLRDFFLNAAKNGWAVTNIHVKGDRALDEYLDLLEEADRRYGISDLRFSDDHCGFITEEQARRAQRLGMTFTCQLPSPIGDGEKTTLGAYTAIYDMERAGDSVAPFRRLVDNGLKPSAHCESHQGWAFSCMQYSVTRKDDVSGRIWGARQRINRREALYTFTRWAAWHVWKEKYIGSIEPGKWGDLVVIDRDYLTIPEDEITQTNPLLTIVGGKISYSEPNYASSLGLPTVGFQAPPDWWIR
ncbi:amidohydrolase family protein [Acidobacteria bacterium AH-259-D05]|nr:amidohydrolase family protein [Acidobacteria bacterium AH-259-D05]